MGFNSAFKGLIQQTIHVLRLTQLNNVLLLYYGLLVGWDSSVAIATELWAGRSGDRIPVGDEFSAPVQTGPGAHPASCTMVTGSFPGVKSGRGVTLTPHPLLVLWSRKSIAIPLLPLWAVRPIRSLSAVPWAARIFVNTGVLYWPNDGPLRSKLVANSSVTIKYFSVVSDGVHVRPETHYPHVT